MQWINTLAAWQWGLLALVPPAIIALYFLKLKRTPLVVPSTYLWSRSIEDLHVNSLWQRMRQNILLFLQLLILLLIIIALLRPSWMSTRLAGERLIFLVDNSASMSVEDVEPSRLGEAKRKVAEMIDAMERGQKAMLISFSDTARVEQSLTDSQSDLHDALESIQPTNRPTALDEALRVAAGMANPGSMRDQQMVEDLEATLYIFSDGRFSDVQGFSLGNLKPVYVPIGRVDTPNVGIVAFSTRPHEERPNQLQAFGRVENHGPEATTTQAELYMNGTLIDAAEMTIAPGASQGLVFDLGGPEAGTLGLRLTSADGFTADSRAWAVINKPRKAEVLVVTPGNDELQKVLGTARVAQLADLKVASPEILETRDHQRQAAAGTFDLIIYDTCRPLEMPRCNTLFIDRLPLAGWSSGEKAIGPQIIDVARAHPLMQYVELGDVDIFEAQPLTGPPGSTQLIDSTAGSLLMIGPREGFEDAVLGFGLYTTDTVGDTIPNTTWPIRQSFPVFMLNALAYLGGMDESAVVASVQPGRSVALRTVSAAERLTVRAPDGTETEVARGSQNTFPFTRTEQQGIYEVLEDGQVTQRFAVNLFDSAESNVAARADTIQIGYVDVQGEAAWEPARQETWKLLLAAALVVLLVEWYIYNRRVYL